MSSIQKILITSLMFSMIISGMGVIINDVNTIHGTSQEHELESLSRMNAIGNISDDIRDELNQAEAEQNDFIAKFESVIGGAIKSLKVFLSATTQSLILISIIEDIAYILGIPSWVVSGLSGMAALIIILSIARIYLRDRL